MVSARPIMVGLSLWAYRPAIGQGWSGEGDEDFGAVAQGFFCFVEVGELAFDNVDLWVGGGVSREF